jgi:DHA2 family methylenomycin A resistance protein-like MFS transporter
VLDKDLAAAGDGPGERPGVVRPGVVRPGRVLAAACIGHGMIVLDTTIVHVAVPAIRTGLDTGLTTMQLVVNAYVIVLAGLVLAGSSAVGRFGSARMFRVGVTVFGAASALCGLAPGGATLVAARALQGLGAILVMPASLVMLTNAYPQERTRIRALAVWAAVAGSPVAFGPLLGGLITDTIGWRAVFLINVPVVLCALRLTSRAMPAEEAGDGGRPQDHLGQVLAVLLLGGATLALVEGGRGWDRPLPLTAGAVALVALLAFVLRQRTFAHPLLPPGLLRAPGFRGFVLVGLLLFAGYYGLVFAVSVHLQQGRGYGAVLTGLSFLPSALPIALVPLLAGRISDRFGPYRTLLAALVVTALGAAVLAAGDSSTPWGLSAGLFLIGVGFGLATVPQVSLVMAAAPPEHAAIASGVLTAGRQSGSSLGVALLGGLRSDDSLLLPAAGALALHLLMLLAGVSAGARRAD